MSGNLYSPKIGCKDTKLRIIYIVESLEFLFLKNIRVRLEISEFLFRFAAIVFIKHY
jgi:hypothetical protein